MPATITARAATYLDRVNSLYEQLRTWFLALDPETTFDQTGWLTLNEEDSGEYEAPRLVIRLSNGERFRLDPRGCNVAGSEGRVDISIPGGREALVYIRGNPSRTIGTGANARVVSLRDQSGDGWAWERGVLTRDIPHLDAEVFTDLLRKLRG